jgi:hypothetical protein
MAAPAASNAPMRCCIASFLHVRLRRIQEVGCVRLQDATLQVRAQGGLALKFAGSVHLHVSRCIPVFITPQVLAACCSTQRQFQIEYLRTEAALVEANGPGNGAAIHATDIDAVLLLSSIGRAADSLLASKHAQLQRLRVAKAAAVHEADDMDGVVEDVTTKKEGLLHIRWPLTPVQNRKLSSLLVGRASSCADTQHCSCNGPCNVCAPIGRWHGTAIVRWQRANGHRPCSR